MSVEIKAWRCEKCNKSWVDKQVADKCCAENKKTFCSKCGEQAQKGYTICEKCIEEKRYENAKKIKYSDYQEEFLYDENKQEYYSDKEELEEAYYDDACDEKEEPIYPNWCYACTHFTFGIDIDNMIEMASEDMYEDFDETDIIDLEELKDFMKKWNKKQTSKTYSADYKTVVMLNE